MIRIIKGDITLEAETADDIRLAMGVLAETGEVATVPVKLVSCPPVGEPISSLPDAEPERPNVIAMPTSDLKIVLVRRRLLDVLNVVLTFPEGITARGICELTGLREGQLSNRMTRLSKMGLITKQPHSIDWVATPLARKAKLVAS